jgi:hypothetical protein
LKLLERAGCTVRKGDGGYGVTVPGDTRLTLRFAGGYAHAAAEASWLPEKLPDPTTLLPPGGQKTAFAASLRLEQFPKDYKKVVDLLFGPVKEGFDELTGGKVKPGVKPKAPNPIKQLPDTLEAALLGLIEQTRTLTLTLDIDPRQHQLALDLVAVPRPGTAVARGMKFLGGARSRFAPMADRADLSLLLHFPALADTQDRDMVPDDVADLFGDYLGVRDRDIVVKLIQVFIATIMNNGIDLGVTASVAGKDDVLVLAGLKVQGGRKLDQLCRDAYKSLSAAEKKETPVTWNHDRHGSARIHRLGATSAHDEEVYVAIRDDVLFLGNGRRGLEAVKQALDDFGKQEAAPSPLLRVRASHKLWQADSDFAKAFAGVAPAEREKIEVRLSVEGGDDLRVRFRMSTHMLCIIPVMEKAEKK